MSKLRTAAYVCSLVYRSARSNHRRLRPGADGYPAPKSPHATGTYRSGRATATAMGHARKWRAVTLLGILLSQALFFSRACEADGQVHQGSAFISSNGACLIQSAVEPRHKLAYPDVKAFRKGQEMRPVFEAGALRTFTVGLMPMDVSESRARCARSSTNAL